MANNRLEELRRRAQERIQQVREQMERGEDVAPAELAPASPPQAERRTEPPPPPTYEAGTARQSPEGRSLEGPSLEVEPQQQPHAQQAAPPAEAAPPRQRQATPARQQRPAGQTAHHRRHSGAASIVSRETLRQAILAQEILGKPVSLRGPRENEDL